MIVNRTSLVSAITVLIVAASLSSTGTAQQNWPGFRNDGSGIVGEADVPTKWSPDDGIAWRSDVPGYGQSAPVVWDGTIFLTSSEGPFQEQCYVHAFDLANGKKLWTSKVDATTKVENYFRNSRAAPTCVVDASGVYSFFAGGDVTAMNHQGETQWSVPLFKNYGEVENERGTASSLAQTEDFVIVLVDHVGPSYIIAINKSDGKIAWKTDRGKRVESWASPVIMKHEDRQLVVASSADSVNVYDAKTGKELWKLDDLQGNHIPSASVVGDSIYVGSTQMYGSNADPDKVAGSNCRIDLVAGEGKLVFKPQWGAERANSYYSTPLAFAGYVYYVNKSGILFCVNQVTGKRVFAHRIGNPCWASAIGVTTNEGEPLVYFVQKNGFTIVLRPGDEFDQVARNQLWDVEQMLAAEKAAAEQRKKNTVPADQAKPKTGPEKMLAGMPEKSLHKMFSYGDPIAYAATIVDGNLLIRTGQHLYCVRGK
ncbi:MAG: PQQ-binding-like beta-propeller repeat protein [Pirellulaceae bacterium]